MKNLAGIGICDISGLHGTNVYNIWNGMIQRCYNKKLQKTKNSMYVGCSTNITWVYFSNFINWYDSNHIESYQLDKDLFIPNNKIYSKDTCLFIPPYINVMITQHKRGKYLSGVCISGKKFIARITMYNKLIHIGTFNTEKEAHQAYINAKVNYFLDEADKWVDINDKIFYGLYRHASLLQYGTWEGLPCYESETHKQ